MPQPYKGTRVRATTRLPAPVAIDANRQAAARRWSLSEYICWAVERANRAGGPSTATPPQAAPEQAFEASA